MLLLEQVRAAAELLKRQTADSPTEEATTTTGYPAATTDTIACDGWVAGQSSFIPSLKVCVCVCVCVSGE